jgi:purine-nucleoside phosphorylase
MTTTVRGKAEGTHPGGAATGVDLYERIAAAAAVVGRGNAGRPPPRVGLILGSGLGGFADGLADPIAIDYADIPGFPRSSIVGHKGRLVIGDRGGARCIAMQGRVHLYEGHTAAEVAVPARVLVALGARIVIVTNAAGGLRPEWQPGTLMLIRDHIDLLRDHALRGPNDDRIGPRFPDMTRAYAPELRDLVKAVAGARGVALEEGVYVAMPGPTYETPAEIRMLQTLGADATGMSTVPEVVAINHMGARAIGVSCITNQAAGISGHKLSHDEVTATAARVRTVFEGLLDGMLAELVRRGELGDPR